MEELFKVINLDEKYRLGNLDVEALGQVKSTKHFPVYLINGKKMIFKPLSRTKPFLTPFFAYSEVYWSYIIRKYFDSRVPRSYLAISKVIEEEQPKYFGQGILVESLTPNGEVLFNLYEYFNKNPESSVEINDYVNYCMKNYDYTGILLSDFIKSNVGVGEDLAYQILLSMLRMDQNFHYENINFYDGEDIVVAPPIDFEYSTPFMYPDAIEECRRYEKSYVDELDIKYDEDIFADFFKEMRLVVGFPIYSTLKRNICLIVRMYPRIVLRFIKELESLICDLPRIIISDPDGYIGLINSDYWEIGYAYYKDGNLEKSEELRKKIKLRPIDKEETFSRISSDILEYSKKFCFILKIYLVSYCIGIDNLEDLTIKLLLNKLGLSSDFEIEDVDIGKKVLKLKRGSEFVYSKLGNDEEKLFNNIIG